MNFHLLLASAVEAENIEQLRDLVYNINEIPTGETRVEGTR